MITSKLKNLTKSQVLEFIDLAAKSEQSFKNTDNKSISPESRSLLKALESLSYTQQKELCALMWLGRYDKDEDSEPDNFSKLMEEAENLVDKKAIVSYLFEKPLKEYLMNGLEKI